MPQGKQIAITKALLDKIADHLFLAFTDQQIAQIIGLSFRSYCRIKASPVWQKIKVAEYGREAVMRRKVWRGEPGWQGAAWMLERKYASQLAKPEIQLQLNTGNTTNNTLVITAEQAANLRNRNANLDQALSKLSPPASRSDNVIPNVIQQTQVADNQSANSNQQFEADPVTSTPHSKTSNDPVGLKHRKAKTLEILTVDTSSNKTPLDSVAVKPSPPAAPTRTPKAAATPPLPSLAPKPKNSDNSRNLDLSSDSDVHNDTLLPKGRKARTPPKVLKGVRAKSK
jgi:hypothetical protein